MTQILTFGEMEELFSETLIGQRYDPAEHVPAKLMTNNNEASDFMIHEVATWNRGLSLEEQQAVQAVWAKELEMVEIAPFVTTTTTTTVTITTTTTTTAAATTATATLTTASSTTSADLNSLNTKGGSGSKMSGGGIFGILLLVLVLVGGSIFYYKKKKSK